ncbi:phosphatase PAP2 family protein [Actinomadura rudentiformis]|uniref:Phosphatase PAP2 family protein n=1 Tax=Actinomadura rudentiformis TaxID=359158 RepID=A0A6H9YNV3_9ACTN|nr:phosphatase PAP2 family protein [Actinomadura rudentiformis]KAB2349151.1 phosphatase PAP2 family protein [Actinomadura rudentiformis]
MRVPRSGGGRLPARPPAAQLPPIWLRPARLLPYALPLAAAVLLAATTLDVLAGGLLRRFDHWVFADGLPPRTGAWHFFWRGVVNGGQYWIVATGAALATVWVAWRHRDQGRRSVAFFLARAGLWLVVTELTIRAAQIGFARTPPRTGADLLFEGGYLSYPSGHAANAAACWIFILAMLRAPRRWTTAGHVLIVGVAFAVVTLGYHWPTDAIAGWALGVVLGWSGAVLVTNWPESQDVPAH